MLVVVIVLLAYTWSPCAMLLIPICAAVAAITESHCEGYDCHVVDIYVLDDGESDELDDYPLQSADWDGNVASA